MSTSGDAFAIAAHLHVLLRRKSGRVTDTEWMATNADYAREIVRHAREKAAIDGHVELLQWADKLEAAIVGMGTVPRRTMLEVAAQVLRDAPPLEEHRYIGRLR